ncbi:hypothetical protein D3C84_174870 [compost metagenome]
MQVQVETLLGRVIDLIRRGHTVAEPVFAPRLYPRRHPLIGHRLLYQTGQRGNSRAAIVDRIEALQLWRTANHVVACFEILSGTEINHHATAGGRVTACGSAGGYRLPRTTTDSGEQRLGGIALLIGHIPLRSVGMGQVELPHVPQQIPRINHIGDPVVVGIDRQRRSQAITGTRNARVDRFQ